MLPVLERHLEDSAVAARCVGYLRGHRGCAPGCMTVPPALPPPPVPGTGNVSVVAFVTAAGIAAPLNNTDAPGKKARPFRVGCTSLRHRVGKHVQLRLDANVDTVALRAVSAPHEHLLRASRQRQRQSDRQRFVGVHSRWL